MKVACSYPEDTRQSILIKSYSTNLVSERYMNELHIDTSKFFNGIEEIKLYQCNLTGYQYYLPAQTAGDDQFYENLEQFSWYYMPWKWEHSEAVRLFDLKHKILEVGSGNFGFVKKLNDLKYDISGIELNENSIEKAKQLNLKSFHTTIEDFKLSHKNTFDVICSFQVLEHISNVNSFIQSQIDCLKIGGKLIICVPNNDSFIKQAEGGILNFPPHHMGRWNSKSLKALTKIFSLRVLKVKYEPLQKYHFDWYVAIKVNALKRFKFFKHLDKFISLKKILNGYVKINHKNIMGHSIMIVFEKTK